jgi:cell wall-associated NlpC family hydrolase
MNHAGHYSTSHTRVSLGIRIRSGKRVGAGLALAVSAALATLAVVPSPVASADTLSSDQAQAAALGAKLNAEQAQISVLNGQYEAATYHLSQVNAQITATKAQIAADQAVVNKDQAQLRTQAVADYMTSGTSSQLTEMFSSNNSTAGIRSEYSAISTSNVTNTVDSLHTAQAQLQTQQNALDAQQTQATNETNTLASSKQQATTLAATYQQQKNSADQAVAQALAAQEAAAAAAAQAAANAKLAAAQAAQATAQRQAAAAVTVTRTATNTASSTGTAASSGGGAAVVTAPPPAPGAGAAGAVGEAKTQLGVEYVWGGSSPATGFDCSGLVMWSYEQVGISLPRTSGAQFAATTPVPLGDIQPGDLLFYGPGGSEHVAMYVGSGEMIEAPETGQTVHITPIRTDSGFAGVGRVG